MNTLLRTANVDVCGSCGASGEPWHCNDCGAEICEECCSRACGGTVCDHCAANPSTDDMPDDEDY